MMNITVFVTSDALNSVTLNKSDLTKKEYSMYLKSSINYCKLWLRSNLGIVVDHFLNGLEITEETNKILINICYYLHGKNILPYMINLDLDNVYFIPNNNMMKSMISIDEMKKKLQAVPFDQLIKLIVNNNSPRCESLSNYLGGEIYIKSKKGDDISLEQLLYHIVV